MSIRQGGSMQAHLWLTVKKLELPTRLWSRENTWCNGGGGQVVIENYSYWLLLGVVMRWVTEATNYKSACMVPSRNFYGIEQMPGGVIICISDLILECFLFKRCLILHEIILKVSDQP